MLLSGTLLQPVLAQQEIYECPDPVEFGFTGIPEKTLCEQYYNFSCQMQIGAGTPYPKSSLLGSTLGGNVCIVGDFEIDAPFTFQNAIVRIDPGVAINVAGSTFGYPTGGVLGINNTKMFACNNLWKGITVGHLAVISVSDNSIIEDAEKAVYATGFSVLSFQNTTFNRNRIGIELETPFPNKWVPGPTVLKFTRNRFTCDAPLNGTADEITEAGVKLKNAYLYAYQSNLLGMNLFSDLRYGIIAQGSFSHIGASYLRMQGIKRIGISMEEGSLQLKDSRFDFCEFYGIRFGLAKLVDIQNTVISISDKPSPELRIGIYFDRFGLNADVNINNLSFGANLDGSISPVRGIQLNGKNSGAGAKIRIADCLFSFQAASSGGIILNGPFSANTVTEIWNNRFYVSSIYSENAGNLRSAGISADGNGNINNLSIKWNTFTSYSVHVFPPGVIGIPQWNWGIFLKSNSTGTNNDVSVNSFNYEVQPLGQGLLVQSFQNTKYCSNTFSGYGFSTAALFAGNCAGTDLTGNIFNYVSPGISGVLNLYDNPAIGFQEHKGNKWYNLFGLEPFLHVRCTGDPAKNKFIVHTPQSTCVNENAPCFSPYHPRKIEPDLMNELFEQQIGSPSPGCDFETPAPVVINGLDPLIAQDLIAAPADDPSARWVLQRHLYQKLRDNPNLVSGHPAFAPFLANYENSSVGRFYEVHKTMEGAIKADEWIHTQSELALADISALADSINSIDLTLEQQGESEALIKSKEELIAQIHSLYWDYDSLALAYRTQVSANLQSAYNLNQTVPVSTAYETNEKTVNQVFLEALMHNNGVFTQEQVAGLESIALQDAKIGGPGVHTAWGLLPECLKEEIEPQYKIRDLSPDMEVAALSNDVKPVPEAAVSIYPNPANSSLTVRHPGKNKGTLALTDMTGKIWLQRQITGDSTLLDIGENTPAGIYLLRLSAEDGSSYVEKVVIQQK